MKATAEEKSEKGDQYFQDKIEKRSGLEEIDENTQTVDSFSDMIIGAEKDGQFSDLKSSMTCKVNYDEENTIVEFIESWEATMKQRKGLENFNKELAAINGNDNAKGPEAATELVRFKQMNSIPKSEPGFALKSKKHGFLNFISLKNRIDPSRCYDISNSLFSEEL